ncbi:hypothetical protein [Lactococcus taiwanensis]|uniref:hypothetical protein n=1 Tax=Lactococcus taiwanensis TaxID=1151742 RepID=UPI003515AD07
MKSLDYFRQAEALLLKAGLNLDDLGDYDERTQRWLDTATHLKNPRTNSFYSQDEIEIIIAARMYFKQFRKLSGFYNGFSGHQRNKKLEKKRLEQEQKLAALGFSMHEIGKILHIGKETVRRHGYSQWKKEGELIDEG